MTTGDKPPFRVANSRLVAENSRWRIFFDHLETPDGDLLVPDYLTITPKIYAENSVTGVIVIPESDGKICLIRNYRHALDSWSYEAVKGFVDEGETPEDAALRETAEEACLEADKNSLVPLGLLTVEASTIRSRSSVFLARDCRPTGQPQDQEPGLGNIKYFDPAETDEMARQGTIEDAGTLVAWFRAAPNLGVR